MSHKQVSLRQLELLVEFMEQHTDFALGRVRSKEGRAVSKRLWSQISQILNAEAVEISSYRTAKEWNRFYNDYKCRIKNKVRKISQSQQKTGGGPGDALPLTEIEERLCSILGPDKFKPLAVRQDPLHSSEMGSEDVMVMEIPDESTLASAYDVEIHDFDQPWPSTSREPLRESSPLEPQLSVVMDCDIGQDIQHPSTSREQPCNSRGTKAKTVKGQTNCSDDSEVEKTKKLLVEIEKAKIEINKNKLELYKERNQIESSKVAAINNLASAAWALLSVLTPEEGKKKRKLVRHPSV